MAKTKKAAATPAFDLSYEVTRGEDGLGARDFVRCDLMAGVITQAELSKTKAALLMAGHESLEILTHGDVSNWDPRSEEDFDAEAGWVLVAVLKIDETDGDVVALFAKKPWPFPKTASGGPDASITEGGVAEPSGSDQVEKPEVAPAPAMSKSDAHLVRKASQFELPEQIEVDLKTFTPRVERHGEDEVSAASLGFKIRAPNTILDSLAPTLRHTLYAAPEGQATLPGVDEATPLLRTKVIETLKLGNAYEGWTLRIYAGFDDKQPFVIDDCKVDKFVVTPHDGGSVELDFRVGSSDIDEHEAGWLYGHQKQDIVITLHAPKVKPDAIDGTVGHPGVAAGAGDAKAPSAGDLFAAAHGGDEPSGETEGAESETEGAES